MDNHNTAAFLFINALKSDVQLREGWAALLEQIKKINKTSQESLTLLKQEIARADNFLAENGFDCDAKDVLAILKAPFFQEYKKLQQPNDDSDRFVKDIMTNTKLYHGWQSAISQATQDPDVANQFLKSHGYQCIIEQVDASFSKIRNHASNYWAGIYLTTLTDSDGNKQDGPVIIVSERGQLSIGQDFPDKRLNKLVFKQSKYSWKQDHLRIKYSADLQFSEISVAKKPGGYTGNIVYGTINFPKEGMFDSKYKGSYKVTGIIGTLDQSMAMDITPAKVSLPKMNKVIKYAGYLLAGIFTVRMIYSVGKTAKQSLSKFTSGLSKDSKLKTDIESLDEDLAKGAKATEEMGSPFADTKLSDSDLVKELEEKIDGTEGAEKADLENELSEEVSSEAEFDQAVEDFSSGESGWLEDLSTVVEDM